MLENFALLSKFCFISRPKLSASILEGSLKSKTEIR